MRQSFKFRIILLSVLTSGLVLLSLAGYFWTKIHRIGLERIDRELLVLGETQVRDPKPPELWSMVDESLAALYGKEKREQFLILVQEWGGRILYRSPHAPDFFAQLDFGRTPLSRPAAAVPLRPPPNLHPLQPAPPAPFAHGPQAPIPMPPPPRNVAPPRFMTHENQGHTWRFLITGNEDARLVLGLDLIDFQAEMRRFRNLWLVATPTALLLLAIAGWLLAAQALRPVNLLTRVTQGITARGLHQRVPTMKAAQEFQGLINVVNRMLDRLEKSFQQAARFSADAAHELKTPLTILQGRLEQELQHAAEDSQEQRSYAGLLEEIVRLKTIVRKLLLLSQADSGELKLSRERVNLSEEVLAVCEDVRTLAPDLEIRSTVAPELYVNADPDLLRQVLHNLSSNAVKHNRPGGFVDLHLQPQEGEAVFTIANSIPPESRLDPERLFERFYRGDPSHNRKIDGVGLGLSLAREIVRAHGGDLILKAIQQDQIAFQCTLALQPAPADAPPTLDPCRPFQ